MANCGSKSQERPAIGLIFERTSLFSIHQQLITLFRAEYKEYLVWKRRGSMHNQKKKLVKTLRMMPIYLRRVVAAVASGMWLHDKSNTYPEKIIRRKKHQDSTQESISSQSPEYLTDQPDFWIFTFISPNPFQAFLSPLILLPLYTIVYNNCIPT